MNTHDVWQALLEELRSSLPAVTYEQNIESAKLLSVDANTFCIGVTSLRTKKYCEMRLTSQIGQFLKQFLGEDQAPKTVRFEVMTAAQRKTKTATLLFDSETSHEKRHENRVDAQPATELPDQADLTVAKQTEQTEPSNLPDMFAFEAAYEGVYEATVTPSRVIVLPGYLIEHLPYLGPQAAWVYTACFQLSFLNHHPEEAIPIRAKDAVRWSGLSKNTFWKQMGENDYLAHFVTLARDNVPTGTQTHYMDDEGRKYRHVMVNQEVKLKREANRYFVQHTMPLTPEDGDRLRDWLLEHGFGTHPIEAMREALETDVMSLLGYDEKRKKERVKELADATRSPIQLVDLVHALLTESQLNEMSALLQPLIESLNHQIQLHFGHVFVPWYFVERWVGLLGAQKAWAVILARKRCYHNVKTGETRTIFTYAHGFPELAYYLRVKNPQSISLWFKDAHTRAGKPNWINLFLRLRESVKRKDQSVSRQFETVMQDLVAPEDLKDVLYSATAKSFLIRFGERGSDSISHILISVEKEKIAMLALQDWQAACLMPAFQQSPEVHEFVNANEEWHVQIMSSGWAFDLGEDVTHKSKLFARLGYPNCVLCEGINEFGTFKLEGVIESGIKGLDAVNDLETFAVAGVIELKSFLRGCVDELATIGIEAVVENGTIVKRGDNDLGTERDGGLDEFGTIFNYLIKYVSGAINASSDLTTDSINHQAAPLAGAEVGEEKLIEFKLDDILKRCNVSYVKQQELKAAGVSEQALISMLLFIASPRGERLGMGYVITRLLEDPIGLTDAYGELASLAPTALLAHLENALRMDVVGAYEWRIVMGGAQDAKLAELWFRLTGNKRTDILR